MKLKINNVRVSLLHDTPLEKAVCKKLGVPKDCLGELKIVRKAVDARKKDNVCLNYHVLADVDVNNKFAKKLLADKDISQYKEEPATPVEFGNMPMSAPPVVIGAGPAGLLAALELAKYGYKPLLLERGYEKTYPQN
jgi:uncharacterized FAD-dependent dehydrogenase